MSQEEQELANQLVDDGFCATLNEAHVLAEVILCDVEESNINNKRGNIESALQDYLDISKEQAKELAARLRRRTTSESDPESAEEEENDANASPVVDDDEEEEDGVALFDGECELCDRYIQLTKHHLIPKSTWPRIQTRLLHATVRKEKGDLEKALVLLGPGLTHVLEQLTTDKSWVRQLLHETCDICRPCHSAVHKAHDNMTLALSYNSVERILEDEQISKFCKWASKQRAGKYSVK
jgi:hypothetical protein